jgi:hypothetical protein
MVYLLESTSIKGDDAVDEPVNPIALKAAVIRAAQTVRSRKRGMITHDTVEQMVADPAIARWMPPWKYRD